MQGDVQLFDLSEDADGTGSIEQMQTNGRESVEKKTRKCETGKQQEEAVCKNEVYVGKASQPE